MKFNSKKNLKLFLPSIISITLSAPFVISCSSNNKDDGNKPEETNEKYSNFNGSQEIKNLLLSDDLLNVTTNSVGLSQEYFEKYKKTEEIGKLFVLSGKQSNNYILEIISPVEYVVLEDKKYLAAKFRISNKTDKNEVLEFHAKIFGYNFLSTNERYIEKSFSKIIDSIYLKEEYKNIRIIDLFTKTKNNEEFINKYIDLDYATSEVIGIKIKLTIPTQNLEIHNRDYLRFNLKIYDSITNLDLTPQTSARAPYLKVESYQKDTFTLINSSDLEKTNIDSLNFKSHFGKLFLRKEDSNSSSAIEINYDFSGKNIVNEIDFTSFSSIQFNSSFSRNNITNILFDSNSTLINLNDRKFSNNFISSVQLPKNVENYDPNCFDDNVSVFGIENIKLIKDIYDETFNLRLDLLTTEQEIKKALDIVTKTNKNKALLSLNNVYLPINIEFENDILKNYQISCNKLIFVNNNQNVQHYVFRYDVSKWNIKEIFIPEFVVKINKNLLPKNSLVTRKLNNKTLSLIENSSLTISKNKMLPFDIASDNSLLANTNHLDDYFYSFSSTQPEISQIIFTDVVIPNNFGNISWDFFTNNNQQNKKIIFNSSVKKINETFYDRIKQFESNNIIIERVNALESNVIQNGVLKLSEFNRIYSPHLDINQYLVGYEKLINSVDTTGVDQIHNNTFKSLKYWENISINLTNLISKVGNYSFSNSTINITMNGFNPTEIGQNAFESSTISGNLEFSNLVKLGTGAFQNCKKIAIAKFDKLTIISDYSFSNSSLSTIEANLVTETGINSFANSSLSNFSANALTKIGSNSFYGTKSLTTFDLTNVLIIEDRAFYNSAITNLTNMKKLQRIGNSAFANCKNLSIDFVLNEGIELGKEIFSNSTKIMSVQNFDFNKYSISENLFGTYSNWFPNVSHSFLESEIHETIGYDKTRNILDLSKFTSISFENKIFLNKLEIFIKDKLNSNDKSFEEVILPNESKINTKLKNIFRGLTIKKLTWNPMSIKQMDYSLSYYINGATILSINEDFCVGMSNIPYSAFGNLNNKTINLINVKSVDDYAFSGLEQTIFTNTLSIKKIGNYSFSKSCEFKIGTDVQLEEYSFSDPKVIGTEKISRDKIFSYQSIFSKIYDQETKILDFSKIDKIYTPVDYLELNKYKGISSYVLDGDVNKLVLPKVYNLTSDFYSNLGIVEEIVFQEENQVIFASVFEGTTFLNKPKKDETKIFLDRDNFFNE